MAVMDTLFPYESGKVMQEVMKATEEESVDDIGTDVELLETLSESYKVAESWQVETNFIHHLQTTIIPKDMWPYSTFNRI